MVFVYIFLKLGSFQSVFAKEYSLDEANTLLFFKMVLSPFHNVSMD